MDLDSALTLLPRYERCWSQGQRYAAHCDPYLQQLQRGVWREVGWLAMNTRVVETDCAVL
jgi:hypothetical protein